jgi:hypothetical protein
MLGAITADSPTSPAKADRRIFAPVAGTDHYASSISQKSSLPQPHPSALPTRIVAIDLPESPSLPQRVIGTVEPAQRHADSL